MITGRHLLAILMRYLIKMYIKINIKKVISYTDLM